MTVLRRPHWRDAFESLGLGALVPEMSVYEADDRRGGDWRAGMRQAGLGDVAEQMAAPAVVETPAPTDQGWRQECVREAAAELQAIGALPVSFEADEAIARVAERAEAEDLAEQGEREARAENARYWRELLPADLVEEMTGQSARSHPLVCPRCRSVNVQRAEHCPSCGLAMPDLPKASAAGG